MSCTSLAVTHTKGQSVRATATFTDLDGEPVDASIVRAKVKPPSASAVTYVYGTDPELVQDSPGVYYIDIAATEAGTWYVRFEAAGDYQAAAEHSFKVASSAFA